jgi:hypothetical protein
MVKCHFCRKKFRNSQAVRAHLKTCQEYQKSKDDDARATARHTLSQRPALATGAPATNTSATPADLVADLMAQMTAQFAGPDEVIRLKQRRESLLALLLANLVDWYRPPEGVVTSEMAAAAKVAILDELRTQPIEDLSHAELTLRGEVIRNRVVAPFLKEQQRELKKQKEVIQREKLRAQKHSDTQARQTTRKAALIELGTGRALQLASSRDFPPRVLVVLEWEIRARLEVLLVGDETESQVDETIEAAIGLPISEWEARVEQSEIAERQRVLEKCLTIALPVVEAAVPWVQEVVVNYIWTMLGRPPSSPSSAHDPSASSMNEAAISRPEGVRTRRIQRPRVRPSSAPLDGKEAIAPGELAPSAESRTGTR